jgi:hypothetical protein
MQDKIKEAGMKCGLQSENKQNYVKAEFNDGLENVLFEWFQQKRADNVLI